MTPERPTHQQMVEWGYATFLEDLANYEKFRSEWKSAQVRVRIQRVILRALQREIVRVGGQVEIPR